VQDDTSGEPRLVCPTAIDSDGSLTSIEDDESEEKDDDEEDSDKDRNEADEHRFEMSDGPEVEAFKCDVFKLFTFWSLMLGESRVLSSHLRFKRSA
jgi:hypothetical protein